MSEQPALNKLTPITLKLSKKEKLSKYVTVFSFNLPETTHTLGTKPGQYISTKCEINGEETIRYYSPLSPTINAKSLDLAIKFDGVGKMSKFFDGLDVGSEMEFFGPIGGFEYDINKYSKVGLIAGGTGISPMLQILEYALNDKNDKTKFKLLYGAIEESELVFKSTLDDLLLKHPDRFEIYYTLDSWKEEWKHGKGYITEEVLKKQIFDSKCDQVVVCGPPKMCQIMDKILLSFDGYDKKNVFNYGRW
eukprot:gene11082-3788_t